MTYKITLATIVAALLSVTAASAEQYVARIDQTFQGPSAALLDALKIVEIDTFEHGGFSYIVVEAPNEGYIEAYFLAINVTPTELHMLQADWTAPGLSGLSLEQRLPFLRPAPCGFCNS